VRDGPGGEIEQLEHAQIGTRLGEGLRESGSLGAAAMERTLAAVETFVARVRAHDAELSSIAERDAARTQRCRILRAHA
jgi:exopolyphosphatase/pppGpp-phosphohydrolase